MTTSCESVKTSWVYKVRECSLDSKLNSSDESDTSVARRRSVTWIRSWRRTLGCVVVQCGAHTRVFVGACFSSSLHFLTPARTHSMHYSKRLLMLIIRAVKIQSGFFFFIHHCSWTIKKDILSSNPQLRLKLLLLLWRTWRDWTVNPHKSQFTITKHIAGKWGDARVGLSSLIFVHLEVQEFGGGVIVSWICSSCWELCDVPVPHSPTWACAPGFTQRWTDSEMALILSF